jgi:hypothetical protein
MGYEDYEVQTNYATQEADKNSTTALILAIVGIFLCGIILEPIAIYMARKAKAVLGKSHPSYGKANAAEIIGWIWVGIFVAGIVIGGCVTVLGGLGGALSY